MITRPFKFSGNSQQGLTLVEILVAVLVSSVLLLGVTGIFISSKTTYNVQEGLSRLQDNARFALDILARDIRMANYLGCAQKNYNSSNILVSNVYRNVLNNSDDFLWDFRAGIQGFEAVSSSWLPAVDSSILDVDATTGSDILSIKILRGSGVKLTTDMSTDNENLTISTNNSTLPEAGDVALITDCTTTTVFQVTNYSGNTIEHDDVGQTPGNSTDSLGYQFLEGARIFPVETVTYYLHDEDGGGPETVSSLRRRVNGDPGDELIEGVESMQITYGLDTEGNDERADIYLSADAVETLDPDPLRSWRQVVSVRIGLLLRTVEEVTPRTEPDDDATYNVNGTVIDPLDDRRLRRVFTTTITMRNRTP